MDATQPEPQPGTRATFAAFAETFESAAATGSDNDRIVTLVVDAKRTLTTVNRLHRLVLILWIPLGMFCYSSNSERRWQGKTFGVLPATDLMQNLWGVCFLMLVALRNDFPINLIGIMSACVFFGLVLGTHSTFSLVCSAELVDV